MNRSMILFVATAAMLLAASVAHAAGVADLVAKTPAANIAEGQALTTAILKTGPDGLKELCGMITPPKDVSDAKARFALHGAVLYAAGPDGTAQRAMVEKALLDAVAAAGDPDVKQFFVYEVQLCGTAAAAEPLGKLLTDDRLCDPATRALVRIGAPACIAQIRGALATAKGDNLVTLIQALGEARDKAAAKAILPYASSNDAKLRRAAWAALANIGEPAVFDVLNKRTAADRRYESALKTKYILLLAARLAEGGDTAACARICRDILASDKPSDGNARCAALEVLAANCGADAIGDVLTALGDKSAYVRASAGRIVGTMKGAGVAVRLAKQMAGATPQSKVLICEALGNIGDADCVGPLTKAVGDADASVRTAAVAALMKADAAKGVDAAVAAMKSTDAGEIAAAQRQLAHAKGAGVNAKVAGGIKAASAPGKAALLGVLATRNATDQKDAVIAALADPASARAAASALGLLAEPKDIPLILSRIAAAEGRSSLADVVVSAIQRTGAGAAPVIQALNGKTGRARIALLNVLAGVGGADGLRVVVADTNSDDKAVQDAAARALANWPDASGLDAQLALIKATDNKVHRVLNLRGYVRLLGQTDGAPAEKVERFAKAMAVADDADEKKTILGALPAVRTPEAMELAMACLDDEALREDAAMAAVKIACGTARRQRPLQGPTVRKNIEKIVSIAKNKWTLDNARKYLGGR